MSSYLLFVFRFVSQCFSFSLLCFLFFSILLFDPNSRFLPSVFRVSLPWFSVLSILRFLYVSSFSLFSSLWSLCLRRLLRFHCRSLCYCIVGPDWCCYLTIYCSWFSVCDCTACCRAYMAEWRIPWFLCGLGVSCVIYSFSGATWW